MMLARENLAFMMLNFYANGEMPPRECFMLRSHRQSAPQPPGSESKRMDSDVDSDRHNESELAAYEPQRQRRAEKAGSNVKAGLGS